MTDIPYATAGAVDLLLARLDGEDPLVSPAKDEGRLRLVMLAMDCVLDRCEETVRQTSRSILCWLVTTHPTPCYNRPFRFHARERSRQDYRRYWKRFLAFVIRAFRMDTVERQRLTGIRFRKEHLALLQKIWEHRIWDDLQLITELEHLSHPHDATSQAWEDGAWTSDEDREEWEEGEPDDEEDEDGVTRLQEDGGAETDTLPRACSDSEEDWEAEVSSLSPSAPQGMHHRHLHSAVSASPAVTEFLELIFRLNITLITDRFSHGRPETSLLVYFSGVLGFSSDRESFQPARNFTPILSRLIYMQRLLFLEYTLPSRAYPYIGIARRSKERALDRLNPVRLQYMIAGSQSALGEFLSLRDAGRTMGRLETPSYLLQWSEDGQTVYHNQRGFSMDEFRALAKHLLTTAEQQCQALMFDVLPEVDLSRLRDDLTNRQPGFSFVKHPANSLADAYLELSTRACNSRRNRLVKDGRWHWPSIFIYLDKTTALLESILTVLYTTCGQVPRAPELLSLEYENTASTERGIYLHQGSMLYLTRHHKAKLANNREFYVARFLPFRAGQVMFYYLTYIRPFAAMLQRERSETGFSPTPTTLLFCSVMESRKAWPSSRLRRTLETATSLTWGYAVNIQLYRQLTIRVTDKHVQDVHRPFNRFDDQGPNADLNVAFAWQSGHRPIARVTNYGLDGAFPTQLQPSLLRAYEWVSTRWHEFLTLGSKSAAQPFTQPGQIGPGLPPIPPPQPSPPVVLNKGAPTQPPLSPPPSSPLLTAAIQPRIPSLPLPPSPQPQERRRKRSCPSEQSSSPRASSQKRRVLGPEHKSFPVSPNLNPDSPGSPRPTPLSSNRSTVLRRNEEPTSIIDFDNFDSIHLEEDPVTAVVRRYEKLAMSTDGFRGLLSYWRGVKCHLCMSYGWGSTVYNHALEDCVRKEAPGVLQILHMLQRMPRRGNPGSFSHCQRCSLPKVFCWRTWYPGDITNRVTFEKALEQEPVPYETDCVSDDIIPRVIAVLLKAHGGLGKGNLARIVACCGDTDLEGEVHQWLSEDVALYDHFTVPRLLRIFDELARRYRRFALQKKILWPHFLVEQ